MFTFHVSFHSKHPAFYQIFEPHYPTLLKKIHMGPMAAKSKFSTQGQFVSEDDNLYGSQPT